MMTWADRYMNFVLIAMLTICFVLFLGCVAGMVYTLLTKGFTC